ncbi:hypothetical protein DSO57_1018240 [Entomophthora muscae]|uniref:Uncharacterized protein n=1 Tax=Entomophthora muscae TaxID=34485 RepID=A0ACC2SH83_9FUNG|nr:hypothetical protein DSO57_1018240 [Entomophthora muscae]
MKPPVTPKPMPASSPNLPTDHTGKRFGIVYITLTGVIATIIPAAGLWSWVRKSLLYLFKLAPPWLWALPAKNPAQVIPKTNRPAAQDWIPDIADDAPRKVEKTNGEDSSYHSRVSIQGCEVRPRIRNSASERKITSKIL